MFRSNYGSPTSCNASTVPIANFKSYKVRVYVLNFAPFVPSSHKPFLAMPQDDICFGPTPYKLQATKYHYPLITTFDGATCTGPANVTTVSDVCYPVEVYPVGNNNHLVSSPHDCQDRSPFSSLYSSELLFYVQNEHTPLPLGFHLDGRCHHPHRLQIRQWILLL